MGRGIPVMNTPVLRFIVGAPSLEVRPMHIMKGGDTHGGGGGEYLNGSCLFSCVGHLVGLCASFCDVSCLC